MKDNESLELKESQRMKESLGMKESGCKEMAKVRSKGLELAN